MTDREKLIQLISEIVVPYFAEQIADHLLANGATFATDTNVGSKWIPVTERMPEDNRKVLICSEKGTVLTMHYDHYWKAWRGFSNIHVTHWMPLPEPPKDGGAESD